MVWETGPGLTAFMLALMLIESLMPAALVWIGKMVIDAVASLPRGTTGAVAAGTDTLIPVGVLYAALTTMRHLMAPLLAVVQGQLNDLLVAGVNTRLIAKANSFGDLRQFEDGTFYDRLQTIQREAAWRPMNLLAFSTQLFHHGIVLVSMVLVLTRYHPLLVLVLVVTTLPHVIIERRMHQATWTGVTAMATDHRRMAYCAHVALSDTYAKEVRLFGLGEYFLQRYRTLFGGVSAELARLRGRHARWGVLCSLLGALGAVGTYSYVVREALEGRITLGDLTLYTAAVMQAGIGAMAAAGLIGALFGTFLYMRQMFAFLDTPATMPVPPAGTGHRVPRPLRLGLALRGVSFRYPGQERRTLESIDFAVPAGRTLALVGENGAGKTTLVKLLARLYDPCDGAILLDGVDLREYDLADLRRHIGVVFQDFARFQLTARENIAMGCLEALHDEGRIRAAGVRSGADAALVRLPAGYETLLGKQFAGGVDLSGGEWQKVALARAFIRDAQMLILDEPMAALDPQSEYALYQRFHELAAGRTTLLISHRLGTVRMADAILVLENGRIVEEGDHTSLMSRGGRYAELYAMQADRYR